ARPGRKLEVNIAAERLERIVQRAGRQLSLGATASAALLGATRLASTGGVSRSLPIALGTIGSALAIRLFVELNSSDKSGR
ncbi:MAG TPA: hypothetical protein VF115_02810, partial [Acidimicrobiia bacterium]